MENWFHASWYFVPGRSPTLRRRKIMDNKFLSIMRWGAIALIAGALTACGGDDSDDGGITPPPPPPASTFDGTVQEGGGSIVGVAVNSPPVISFKLQDSAGNPVQPTSLTAVRAALAKYIPGAPDRWIPFGTKVATPDPTKFMVSNENRSCGQTGDGWAFANVKYDAATAVYTYHFCTDVTTLPDWDASAAYRIGLEVQYNDAPTAKVRTTNPLADFTVNGTVGAPVEDSTGKDKLVRDMVAREACNSCHNDLGQQGKFHGNRRIDPNYCVVCHTDSAYDPETAESLEFRVMAHKFHMGSRLTGSYAPSGVDATEMHFPQDQRNCTKCHTDVAIEGNPHVTPQGGNWRTVPSRNACGACHDGINFDTGGGTTLDPTLPWASLGHVGGAQPDDSKCADCHSSTQIAGVNHIPVTAVTNATTKVTTYYASNDGRLPAGAHTIDYQIQSVSKNASGNPVMVFRILQDGARVDLNPQPVNATAAEQQMLPNFWGGPTAYFAYSIEQDGIAKPADFNAYVSGSVVNIWNRSAPGTLAGPDANGFYTLTLTSVIPANASLLTGALGYAAMLQTNVPGYLRTCGVTPPIASTNCVVGINVTAEDVKLAANANDARRITTDTAACNNCHQKLGLFAETTFHSGQRNDPTMCAMCHNPNRSSSGWSADSTAFVHAIHGGSKRSEFYNWHSVVTVNGASVASSYVIQPSDVVVVEAFGEIGFPGNLNNCLNCHAPGGYDFSSPGGLDQVGRRLYRTAAQGTMAAAGTVGALSLSSWVDPGVNYGTNDSQCAGDPTCVQGDTNLVNSPIANACFGCHDGQMTSDPSVSVRTHIETLGNGSIYRTRTAAKAKQEQCLTCHGPTQVVPIKAAHGL